MLFELSSAALDMTLTLKAGQSFHVSPLLRYRHWLPIEKRIREKFQTISKPIMATCPSIYLNHSRNSFMLLDHLTLLKLITVDNQSVYTVGHTAWNSVPHSLRAGTLACTHATPGNACALDRCYFRATIFDDLSPDFSYILLRAMRKCADSLQGSVLAIKNSANINK